MSGYLDAASTEPLHPVARQALTAALDAGWADPARLYGAARRTRMLLDHARESVAGAVGARPDEVRFTSSGTAAVHVGVLGCLRGGGRVVVSAVEHSAVLHAARRWERDAGGRVTVVGVDGTGRVDPTAYAAALHADGEPVRLACLQTANHEVGTVQPVEEVAAACAERGVPLLVDAAQSLGRLPLPPGWSLLTASAHKWGGPAGVGLLVVRRGTGARAWRSPLPDDAREDGVPGFVDVPAVLAAATALEAVLAAAAAESPRLHALVDRLRARVPALVPDVALLGHPEHRLPHLLAFSCLYVDGEAIVGELDRRGFAVSSGSSCASGALEPSHVLAAMGALTHGNVRVSLPFGTGAADVDAFLAALPDAVDAVRAAAGVAGL